MSYRTKNVIVKSGKDNSEIIESLLQIFDFCNVRAFYTPFYGIVCQINLKHVDEEYIESFLEKVTAFSKNKKELKVACIEVDCFGGRCISSGFIIQNGEILFEKEWHHSAHILILKELCPKYNSWFFYPFTRTFFQDKGGINGEIIGISMPALSMSLSMESINYPTFKFSMSENELLFIDENQFEFYLMNVGTRIKVMGRLFNNDSKTIDLLSKYIRESLGGFKYHIEIDNFDNGNKKVLSDMNETEYLNIIRESYRTKPFNELNLNESDDKISNEGGKVDKITSQIIENSNRKSLFHKIIKKLFHK